MGMAQIQLIGNVGKDPDMSYTPQGAALTKFSLAVTKKQGDKEVTTWYNCVAWRTLAETLNSHVKKGQQLFVQGDFSPREYTTRENQQRTSLDVTVEKFQFIGAKTASNGATTGNDQGEEHPF